MYPKARVYPQVKKSFLQQQRKVVEKLYKEFGKQILEKLAQKAAEVRTHAYAPYSDFQVGAALLRTDGKIFKGVNAEAITYTQTSHAEEIAVRSAISQGAIKKLGNHFISALVYVSPNSEYGAPCGHCRQIIREHADNCVIAQATTKGKIVHVATLELLLPLSFSVLKFDNK